MTKNPNQADTWPGGMFDRKNITHKYICGQLPYVCICKDIDAHV